MTNITGMSAQQVRYALNIFEIHPRLVGEAGRQAMIMTDFLGIVLSRRLSDGTYGKASLAVTTLQRVPPSARSRALKKFNDAVEANGFVRPTLDDDGHMNFRASILLLGMTINGFAAQFQWFAAAEVDCYNEMEPLFSG